MADDLHKVTTFYLQGETKKKAYKMIVKGEGENEGNKKKKKKVLKMNVKLI
jgi:hypothetical protein